MFQNHYKRADPNTSVTRPAERVILACLLAIKTPWKQGKEHMSRILIVDDDVDLAELVKTKLASEGHEVVVTNSGDGAFELAKKAKPEIAILDIMLPGVTGYQICRKIRIDPELYNTGILLLTALGEEPEVYHGLEQGADDYVVKPFKLEKLVDKLESLKQLLESVGRRNPVTNLPGTDALKREINHRLARGTKIAVCYIDMVGFKAYGASRGKDGQTRGLAFMSKLLTSFVQSAGIYETFVTHMGGEHFAVLLNFEDFERFGAGLMEIFDQRVKELYAKREIDQAYIIARDKRGGESRFPLMALSIGVVHNDQRDFKSAKKILEILSQVNSMNKTRGKSAMFVDRRCTER